MLYKLGTIRELTEQAISLPEPAMTELVTSLTILDSEYGEDRDYLQEGGYSVIIETAEDILQFKAIVDYDAHPCEWATRQGSFVSALFLLNDDYAIMAFMPLAIAPRSILEELE